MFSYPNTGGSLHYSLHYLSCACMYLRPATSRGHYNNNNIWLLLEDIGQHQLALSAEENMHNPYTIKMHIVWDSERYILRRRDELTVNPSNDDGLKDGHK